RTARDTSGTYRWARLRACCNTVFSSTAAPPRQTPGPRQRRDARMPASREPIYPFSINPSFLFKGPARKACRDGKPPACGAEGFPRGGANQLKGWQIKDGKYRRRVGIPPRRAGTGKGNRGKPV